MTISRNPGITAGTIAGLFLAAWNVIGAQGLLSLLTPDAQEALHVFINMLVPILAAMIAARFSTSTASPNLPIGTVVNLTSDEPNGIVIKAPPPLG